jgi:hypothetical protein
LDAPKPQPLSTSSIAWLVSELLEKSGSHRIDKTICFSPTIAVYCHDLVTVAAKGEKREYNFVIQFLLIRSSTEYSTRFVRMAIKNPVY